ncbi:hypothetical protein KJ359_012104 [Pestalotiopsis sp. 9143b]|nr:hypothetical protein KJ359_012104 [Pestalotiopsis sp. 9143b]
MPHKIYVLVYHEPLFAAHWSLWIPQIDPSGREKHIGDRIHATGDRLNGFIYEYDRDYNVKEDDRHPSRFPIASVPDEHLNDLDAACQKVPAPGPSLNKVAASADKDAKNLQRPKKAEVKDCQWWIEKVVPSLISEGILLALEGEDHAEAIMAKVKDLPRH